MVIEWGHWPHFVVDNPCHPMTGMELTHFGGSLRGTQDPVLKRAMARFFCCGYGNALGRGGEGL